MRLTPIGPALLALAAQLILSFGHVHDHGAHQAARGQEQEVLLIVLRQRRVLHIIHERLLLF